MTEKLVVGSKEAAKLMGISEATFWRRKKEGKLPPFRQDGRLILFPVDKLKEWIGKTEETAI